MTRKLGDSVLPACGAIWREIGNLSSLDRRTCVAAASLLTAILVLAAGMEVQDRIAARGDSQNEPPADEMASSTAQEPSLDSIEDESGTESALSIEDSEPAEVLIRGGKFLEIALQKSLTVQFLSDQTRLPPELVERLFASKDVVLPLDEGERIAAALETDLAALRCLPQ